MYDNFAALKDMIPEDKIYSNYQSKGLSIIP